MNEQIKERLAALRAEFAQGQQMLADQEVRQNELRDTLLRISGARCSKNSCKEPKVSNMARYIAGIVPVLKDRSKAR